MSGFKKFINSRSNEAPTLRQQLEQKNKIARTCLMLISIITLINSVTLFFGNSYYYIFSAFLPYYLILEGLFACGKLPAEWYEGVEDFELSDTSLLVTLTAISAVIILVFAVCWLLSKKYPTVSFSVALGLFILDSAALLYIGGIDLSMIIDYLFHACILYYLVIGIRTAKKLKTTPAEELDFSPFGEENPTAEDNNEFDLSFDYKVDEPTDFDKTEADKSENSEENSF